MVRALLSDPAKKWRVVALTRDKNSEKAQELSKLYKDNVNVVACDLNNASDVESALKGAYGVFGLTDFWAAHSADIEIQQGKNIIDASKKVGVKHLVFSSLEDTVKVSKGARNVPHFVSKAKAEEHLHASNVPYTVVEPAAYYENMQFMVKPGKDGVLEFTLPIPADSKFAQFAVEDTGLVVAKVLESADAYRGKRIALVGDKLSPSEMAATLSKHFGKEVRFNSVPEKVFATFPFPGADELANMFNYFHEFGYFGEKVNSRDIWEGKAIAPLRTFAEWAQTWKL